MKTKKPKTWSLGVLQMLFNEVLEFMPPETADELVAGYKSGRNIMLILGESSFGNDKKTAFGSTLIDDQSWRNLPPSMGGIQ
jgi:hypothetical protein